MNIAFYSCMSGVSWGGSEELWWRAARRLQGQGHQICVNFKWWPEMAFQLRELQNNGGHIHLRNQPSLGWRKKWGWLTPRWNDPNKNTAKSWLQEIRPDMVLITIGYHPDRLEVARDCHELAIPYAINVQCASSFFFIHSDLLPLYRAWYQNAAKVYFVSEENQNKLETNLAMRLPNAEIVNNPYNVDHSKIPLWPEVQGHWRLGCVGRIHFQSKGHDILVDVLKQDKWKARPITIHCYGKNQGNQRQLEELIKLHGLENHLFIAGFKDNVNQIWAENHALVLPSRYEGAPLCVVEAMLCNRLCITTDVGRNCQLMDDGVSGFIARGATVELFDDAMERAWAARKQWRDMGILAGQHIRQRYTPDPVGEFSARLTDIAARSSSIKTQPKVASLTAAAI